MERKLLSTILGALLLVALPAVVHTFLCGAYVVDPQGARRTFWIGPISTTVPYLLLALIFLVHVATVRHKHGSLLIPYLSALLAWLGMMSFTAFLAFQTPGPGHSSTMGIAVCLTPFFYVPFLLIGYGIGTILGSIVGTFRK